jgi:hypothetical protein
MLVETKFCACGCKELIFNKNKNGILRFKRGHNRKGKQSPMKGHFGEKHSSWKGGKFRDLGYIYVNRRDHHFANKRGYVKEHRLVWEQYNKAMLLPWADVHHINEIRDDNRIENLRAMMKKQHGILHNPKKDMSNRNCFKCGSKTRKKNEKGCEHWFRHPITREEWLCYRCYVSELRKSKKNATV